MLTAKAVEETYAPVAQPDRASVCGTGGRGFESLRVRQLSTTLKIAISQRSIIFRPEQNKTYIWKERICGEMSEWMKEHAWKACKWETVSGVRIPVSPPVWVIRAIGRYEPCQSREEAALSIGRCVRVTLPVCQQEKQRNLPVVY